MSFFHELKRRNVFKVAASYAIVAWLLIEVAATVSEPLQLPAWFATGIIVLLLLGFPVALLLAWAFELTPDGIKPTVEVPVESSIRAHTGHKMNLLILGGMAVLLVLVVVDAYVLDAEPAHTPVATATDGTVAAPAPIATPEASPAVPDLSIAVLPIRDLSPGQDQRWLADGISEEITDLLTRVDDLLVINTNSSFQFRDQEQNFVDIRNTLKVRYLLTGSLRRNDADMRLTVQLSSTSDGTQLWSRTYENRIDDVFAVQEQIAESVSRALQITLATGTFGRTPGMTRNIAAYEEFLRSTQEIYKGETVPNVRSAIGHLENALRLDPDYSVASFTILDLYTGLIPYIAPPSEFPERESRAAEALAHIRRVTPDAPFLLQIEADADLRNGNVIQAAARMEAARRNSLQIIPDAMFTLSVGRIRAAVPLLERARAADPLNTVLAAWTVEALANSGDYARAQALLDTTLQLPGQQDNARLMGMRILLALYRGDPELLVRGPIPGPALLAASPVPGDDSGPSGASDFNAEMVALLDDPEAALRRVREAAANSNLSPQGHNLLAMWASFFGDPEFALAQLRISVEMTNSVYGGLMFRPLHREARKLDGFRQLVTNMGLVDYWRASGDWGDYCRPLAQTENDFECF